MMKDRSNKACEHKRSEVLNPGFGDLKQLLQCCGKSASYASEIATLVNTNAITGDIEKTIRERYVGNGKCEDPGLGSLKQKGNPTCAMVTKIREKTALRLRKGCRCQNHMF